MDEESHLRHEKARKEVLQHGPTLSAYPYECIIVDLMDRVHHPRPSGLAASRCHHPSKHKKAPLLVQVQASEQEQSCRTSGISLLLLSS